MARRKHGVTLGCVLAGCVSTCLLIVNPSVSFSAAETPPLKLTIRAEKEAYGEGDQIRLLYTIDVSAKLVRVYRVGHRRDVYR